MENEPSYVIVRGFDVGKVSLEVRVLLNEGYLPQGGLATVGKTVLQAMFKPSKKE